MHTLAAEHSDVLVGKPEELLKSSEWSTMFASILKDDELHQLYVNGLWSEMIYLVLPYHPEAEYRRKYMTSLQKIPMYSIIDEKAIYEMARLLVDAAEASSGTSHRDDE